MPDNAGVVITDHALLRYLERVVGFDFSGYRDTLARRLDEALCASPSANAFVIDGHIFVMSLDRLITVLPEGAREKRKAQKKRQRHGRPLRF